MTGAWLEDVADYLIAQGVTPVYTHSLPPGTSGVVLAPTGGAPGDAPRAVQTVTVQAMVRGATPSAAYTQAWQVHTALNDSRSVSQGATYWSECRALQPPFSIGRDEAGQYLFSTNYQLWIAAE